MRAVGLVMVLVSLWLCDARAEAQQQAPIPITLPAQSSADPPRDPGAFARGAAIYGIVASGLLLGGAITIAAVDDVHSEHVTRGVWLGTVALSAPFVALGGWTARKRTGVKGYKGVRFLGFTSWTFGVANGILQWYEALHDESQPWGLTVALGADGVMATLPLSLDAFISGRRASKRHHFVRFSLGPLSLRGEF
jgi:hypothetical protein